MMCSRLLRHEEKRGPVTSAIERGLDRLTEGYRRMLESSLQRGWMIGGIFVTAAVLCGLLFLTMKQELSPIEDRGVIFTAISGPDGASLEYTEHYARRIESIAKTLPEVDRIFVVSGNPTVDQAVAFLRTTDWSERSRKTVEMIREVQPKMAAIPGVLAFPNAPPSLGQSIRERPVGFVVTSSDSYEAMGRTVGLIVADVMKNPNFLVLDEPTNDLDIDTLAVLEDFLLDYAGCLVVVTHDRYFMDKLVDHVFAFEGEGKVRDFPGNYTEYRSWKAEEDARVAAQRQAAVMEEKAKPV